MAWQNHLYAEAGYAQLSVDTRGQGWAARRRHPGPDGRMPGRPTRARTHDQGHPRPGDLLLPAGATPMRCARWRPPAASTSSTLAASSSRAQARAAASPSPRRVWWMGWSAPCRRSRSSATSSARSDSTNKDPYHEMVRYLERYRDRGGAGARHPLVLRRREPRAAGDARPPCSRRRSWTRCCPPSTVYAAHNAWGATSSIDLYRFNGHEGSGRCASSRSCASSAKLSAELTRLAQIRRRGLRRQPRFRDGHLAQLAAREKRG